MNAILNGAFTSDSDFLRYNRQLKLLGQEGQHKLRDSTVFVAGIGGLGGTAALYLAAAGIGRLILAHEGVIALPDMNRQILMDSGRVGEVRVESAVEQLRRINPEVHIEAYPERISGERCRPWIAAADVAVDARYDFPERYELNRLCVEEGKPMVEAAMYGFEVSITSIIPGTTPCLSCIYPKSNPVWEPLGFPVLGATAGIAGCLAALEAIKILTGTGKPYYNKLHRLDTLEMRSYTVALRRDPSCPCCSGIAADERNQTASKTRRHVADGKSA